MSICHSIKSEYESLQTLTAEFVLACENLGDPRALSADQLRTLQLLKQRIETAREALKEKIAFIIHVENALNPYSEALLESGIPNIEDSPESRELIDITINLRETIKEQQEIYRSMGLTAWAENIAKLNLSHLTPEKRRTIEQEIKYGAIPIIMPGREILLNTTAEHLRVAFKPTLIMDTEVQDQKINDASMNSDFVDIIDGKAKELGDGVSDRPYVALMRPTQEPDERTCDKIVDRQNQEFILINIERKNGYLSPVYIASPQEYVALQIVYCRLAMGMMPDHPDAFFPIDSASRTRFINLPIHNYRVFDATVDITSSHPRGELDSTFADFRGESFGFRLAVRVEL